MAREIVFARRTAAPGAILLGLLTAGALYAAPPPSPTEARMQTPPAVRDVDTHHLFSQPSDRAHWQARASALRRQILFSAGLWPLPEKTPLQPQVTGRIEGDGFSVENIAIETTPGFYLCGNLYRPLGKKGPFPAIVNPHGHWAHGRLEVEEDVPPAAPPPAQPSPGRANLVAIGVNLARQGFVVFAYDMVGYNDTDQVDHKFANGPKPWLWNVSILGLQLWDSIRAVDYVAGLPDVDKGRIGVTGASGGGTQTFLLCAVDDRIKAAVPVNMVSAYMQGGCLCENGPGLRVGTDNVEIAAAFAPKPLFLVAATGDWTRHVPDEEGPAIRRVYDLFGAGDRVAWRQFNYEHNYNVESREAMYAWFGRWLLHDSDASHFREKPFALDTARLRVWSAEHPRPAGALNEPDLTAALIARAEKHLDTARPRDVRGLATFRAAYAPALAQALAVEPPPAAPRATGSPRTVVIAAERAEDVRPELTAALQAAGRSVRTVIVAAPDVAPDKLWAAYFITYNRSPLGDRVQAIADALRESARGGPVGLIGLGGAGLPALLARAVAGVDGPAAVDAAGFHNGSDDDYLQRLYAPGLRMAGGVDAAAMLVAPSPLLLFGAGDAFQMTRITPGFTATGARLRAESGPATPADLAAWMGER